MFLKYYSISGCAGKNAVDSKNEFRRKKNYLLANRFTDKRSLYQFVYSLTDELTTIHFQYFLKPY